MAISRQKEARSRDYALLLFRMTSRVLCNFRSLASFEAYKKVRTLQVNTQHLYDISTMLDQRRKRWADVVQML